MNVSPEITRLNRCHLSIYYILKKYIYKSQSLSLKTSHYQVWNTLLNDVQPFATTMHNRTVAAQDSIQ